FDNVRDLLNHPHVPTRLQALDLWLSHRQAEALPQLKQALASSVAPERVLGLVHYQKMQAEPALKKNLPGIPAAEFLRWTQQSDQSIAVLRTWTFHPLFRSGDAPPATLHAFLGQWLDAGPTDMVKLGENSLLLLLKHEHPAVRAFALGRLAKTGNPAYGPRLEALFEDPDPAVRLRAHDALDLLQKLVPLQYLESLKDAKALPPDTPNRIRSLMRNPETRAKLLEPPYRHLARQPVFLEELWNLLQTSTEPELLFKGLQTLRAAPSNWPLTRLQPLLEPSQDVRVRTSALAAALQRPYSPELGQLLKPLLRDPQVELPLEILNYLFGLGAFPDTRNLMQLLSARADQRVDRRLLSFDGVAATAPLDTYVAERLSGWIKATDRKGATLPDWLAWIRDPSLPVPWRRTILRLVGNEGRSAALIPILRQLVQDQDLAFDAEFALDAVEARVESAH
ncbi:MAG TPA: HEAT repeat domain-containing protein, partial [Candidatus Obscuribacterales bacterium]